MTRVMMCGARSDSDIRLLTGAGVDAIGLITEVSQPVPCNLTREVAGQFARIIPPFTASVLIVTEEQIKVICQMVEDIRPDILQLHGFNLPADIAALCEKSKVKLIKTLHFRGASMAEPGDPITLAREYLKAGVNTILVDSSQENKVGSTGRVMDLGLAKEIRDAIFPGPFILAGGLNAGNVAAAIEKVRPYAVDVFSGVTEAGFIDQKKVREFATAVSRSSREPEVRYVTG
jgi:phosphoribosylanthranilate isomerase